MKIGIFSISSASGFSNKNWTENVIKFLKKQDHEFFLTNLFWKNDFYRSGNIKESIQKFNDLLNQKYDLYIFAISGYCS